MSINTSKHINHTKEEVEEYLNIVKRSVNAGKFVICTTAKNDKNRKFIEKYKLDSNKQKQMLIQLETTDFCYSADNYNDPQERLYFFCREYELNNWGTIEKVEVYIKIAIKKENFIVVISFHKPEKNIEKLFL
ncbi:MAG: type II toxin-antitoxin system MqsR family toxin [Clostridia bacterium]|nr:type II toxin-antitoxin system MqsR family toxin [Clostridia bacterium]